MRIVNGTSTTTIRKPVMYWPLEVTCHAIAPYNAEVGGACSEVAPLSAGGQKLKICHLRKPRASLLCLTQW